MSSTLEHRPGAAVTLDRAALSAHLAWLGRGARGPGRIVVEGRSMHGEHYGAVDLSFARVARCDLTNSELAGAVLEEASLEVVDAVGANFEGASFTHAVLRGGDWSRARLVLARFDGATVAGTRLGGAELGCSRWDDARVSDATFDGARFGNAILDRAVFDACSFRDTSFARTSPEPAPTGSQAEFFDCDLRGSAWTGRDLRGTTFTRCKLTGTHGLPGVTEGVRVLDCDLDLATWLSQLART